MAKQRFQIEHLAQLARLKLSKTEKHRYSDQLSEILDYVEQLQEVDTRAAAPISQVGGLKNIIREDRREKSFSPEETLKNAGAVQGDYFKVKKILEQE